MSQVPYVRRPKALMARSSANSARLCRNSLLLNRIHRSGWMSVEYEYSTPLVSTLNGPCETLFGFKPLNGRQLSMQRRTEKGPFGLLEAKRDEVEE